MNSILTIVGARPQFVKAAVVSKALKEADIEEQIIHTGQHYDHEMSTVFWDELGLPAPSINLEVGSGPHGKQTGIMMQKIEDYIFALPNMPSAMLVYGDTNSTLAGAIVASKLHIPIIHVEAGLRSFNRKMPEEINRILTDQVSELLFCSSEESVAQLEKEQIVGTYYNVGDVMYDAFNIFGQVALNKYTLDQIIPFKASTFYLATIHRPSNTDNSKNLQAIVSAFSQLDNPVVWPVHPRNKARLKELQIPKNLFLVEPLSYFKMNVLLQNASKVLTDSGGLQKEAYWAKCPCITIREETEWVETLNGNWNQLAGADTQKICTAVASQPTTPWVSLYGNGNASLQIADIVKKHLTQLETKKPNILFISLGDSSFIREDRMILKGFTHLYTYSFPPKESSIKLFNAIFLLKNFLLQFFWLLVNIRKASLIYCWFADYHGFLPAIFAKIAKIPVVTVIGGTDANIVPSLGYGVLLSKWRRVLSTVLIKNPRLLLPVDETLIQSNEISIHWPESHPNGLMNNIHSLKTPWKTIPTGYSADAWPEPTNVKREKIVSAVAFLNSERTALIKGIDFFIETARCLPDFTFKIVGVSPEVARVLTQKYAPSTNVEMLPPMERAKLANIYAETSVYCQLSRTEGLPNVLCEAMMCGCFFCSIPKVCMSYFGGA